MARLILLNGPPGVGKSTLAARYVADHPLALHLEIDAIRASLGGWQDIEESKLVARRLARAMAEAHLRAGHDVVMPQYLGRTDFIADLDRLASACDGELVEVLLWDSSEVVRERFQRRRAQLRAEGGAHPEADVDDASISSAISDAFARLEALEVDRPRTRVISVAGSVDRAYEQLRQVTLR